MKKIGIIGSPGAGKTTLSAGLFYNLKVIGYHVELVPELIKFKVYRGEDFTLPGFDILNTLEQMELEQGVEMASAAGHGLEFLICEAPLCNGYFYASFYGKNDELAVLKTIAKQKLTTYDLLIFVTRNKTAEYVQVGRKESLEQANRLENHIRKHLKDIHPEANYLEVDQTVDIRDIVDAVLRIGTTD